MPPVVIVHGSYHRPAHYDAFAERLRERGVEVVVPDIGGLPLPVSTARVQEVVDALGTPPIVVGHSFGGAVAGALRGVARMVFLTAWVLDADETALGLLSGSGDDWSDSEFAAALRPSSDGLQFTIDPASATGLFYADCSPADAARAVALLRADIAANFSLTPEAVHWRDTPSTYIRTERDRTWPASLPPRFVARCTTTISLPTGHSPYLSRPDELAALVLDA